MIAQGRPVQHNPPPTDTRRSIPFDYAFRIELDGVRERQHTSSVTVSIESEFTAVSIGYGIAPSRKVSPMVFGAQTSIPKAPPAVPTTASGLSLMDLTLENLINGIGQAVGEFGTDLGPRTADALRIGIRLNPEVAEFALDNNGNGTIPDSIVARLFQVVAVREEPVQFLYSLVDEGSGREFQSEPILSTSGLGASNGDRPFRPFARPIVFAPMSTITMRVTELSQFQGELHISLQGYKTLGGANSPTSARSRGRRR